MLDEKPSLIFQIIKETVEKVITCDQFLTYVKHQVYLNLVIIIG